MLDVTLKSVRGTGIERSPVEPESVMGWHHPDPTQALAAGEGATCFGANATES